MIVALCFTAFEIILISRSLKSSVLKSYLYERSMNDTGLSGSITPSVSAIQTTIYDYLSVLDCLWLDPYSSVNLTWTSFSELSSDASEPSISLKLPGDEARF